MAYTIDGALPRRNDLSPVGVHGPWYEVNVTDRTTPTRYRELQICLEQGQEQPMAIVYYQGKLSNCLLSAAHATMWGLSQDGSAQFALSTIP